MKNLLLITLVFLALTKTLFAQSNSGFAVVLIDMQDGFYRRGGVTNSEKLKKLVASQVRLLSWATQQSIPVLVFEYQNYGVTDPKLMSVLRNHKFKVIEKNTDGGFYGESRVEALELMKKWKVVSIIVAGINGPFCVEDTIKGALENGINVMTTAWVIGNINDNPPIYPNGSWYFKSAKFTVWPTLESIIQ